MNKYRPTLGFTGSEIERATMSGSAFPIESALERVLKKQIAKSLNRLASYLDPSNLKGLDVRKVDNSCC